MKRIYIKPVLDIDEIEAFQILAGTIPPEGEDYTGGDVTPPGKGDDDADVGAKGSGGFFFDFPE